jgi:hypothetical protein
MLTMHIADRFAGSALRVKTFGEALVVVVYVRMCRSEKKCAIDVCAR